MVLEVDLTQSQEEAKAAPKINLEQEPAKTSLIKKIKNKIRIWKANFAKTPLSHKLVILFVGLSVSGLAAVAIIYGFVIFTIPAHQPLDASFRLLEVQERQKLETLFELPTPPEVKDQENPINGELYTEEEFEKMKKRKPLAVMIENHTDARPQAGLSTADLVYETLAESGITRFMAIYWGQGAQKLMPIRSVRTYFLDWAAEYDDPPLMNIGQAGYEPWEAVIVPEADARSYIKKYNVKSFSWYGRHVYFRDYERYNSGIAWEHVAYTDTATLWKDAKKLGWIGPADITPLKFKRDAKKEKRGSSQQIEIKFLNLSSETCKVKWEYDKDSNTYKRSLAGKSHIDANGGKQISAKNIIIQHVKYRATGDRNGRIVLTTIGNGKAEIFKDGVMVQGVWEKSSRTDRTKFYDKEGNEVELNRGQIWIEVVPVSGSTDLSEITIK